VQISTKAALDDFNEEYEHAHSSLLGAYLGLNKTISRVMAEFFQSESSEQIKRYVLHLVSHNKHTAGYNQMVSPILATTALALSLFFLSLYTSGM